MASSTSPGSISSFTSQMNANAGMARMTHYEVIIPLPKIISSLYGNEDLKVLSLMCEQATLPGLNWNSAPVRTYGETVENPYEPMFNQAMFSFYVTGNMQAKKFIDDWITNIRKSNRNMNYYNDYISNVAIKVQDLQHNDRYTVTLFEAYPKTVQDIQLGYNNGQQVMTVQSVWAYRYWQHVPSGEISNNEGSINDNPVDILKNTIDSYVPDIKSWTDASF